MIKVEIYKLCPSIFNGFERGYKVLQYETIAGNRYLCGSRHFEGIDAAERYKAEIEEWEARNGPPEKEINARTRGMLTAHYKDGTTRKIHPKDAILLSLEDADKIERFEEDLGGKNTVLIEGLNARLLSGDLNEAKEDEGKDSTQ